MLLIKSCPQNHTIQQFPCPPPPPPIPFWRVKQALGNFDSNVRFALVASIPQVPPPTYTPTHTQTDYVWKPDGVSRDRWTVAQCCSSVLSVCRVPKRFPWGRVCQTGWKRCRDVGQLLRSVTSCVRGVIFTPEFAFVPAVVTDLSSLAESLQAERPARATNSQPLLLPTVFVGPRFCMEK